MGKVAMVIALVLMMVGSAQAGDAPLTPPSPLVHATAAPATVKVPLATTLNLGKLRFELEKTSMKDVVAAIGVGQAGRMGDGGDTYSWLCYTVVKAKARLWLSAGESGKLDTVTAQASNLPAERACPAMPAAYDTVTLDGHIWLGMTEADLQRRLGTPGQNADVWRAWHRQLERARDGVDEDGALAVRLDGGNVVYFEASRDQMR